jgi:phosphoglycolate phosphatase
MKTTTITNIADCEKNTRTRYRLIIFDFDGTLCHTEGADIETIHQVYSRLGKPAPSIEMIQATLGKGLMAKAIFQDLNPQATPHFIHQLLAAYNEIYPTKATQAELFPGVIPLLTQLHRAAITLIILSNKAEDMLQAAIRYLQLGQYFALIMGTNIHGRFKPDPNLYYQQIAPHFPNIPPCEILMVGDTSMDLQFAAAIPIDSCWARYGGGDPTSCQMLNPNYTIQTISEVRDIALPPNLV